MNILLSYADPAGNITALVESAVAPEMRAAVARAILAQGRAEQVGFIVPAEGNISGRLQMMGGEFCGNAARSFGYLLAMDRYAGGVHTMDVEISGTPVRVTADLDQGSAWADMPLPLGAEPLEAAGTCLTLVHCPGIVHAVAENTDPDPDFVRRTLDVLKPRGYEAVGVLFLTGDHLTPAVYVTSTDSLVWESSCGSGATACSWVRAQGRPDGQYAFSFVQPGGTIGVTADTASGKVRKITMGGALTVSPSVQISLDVTAL